MKHLKYSAIVLLCAACISTAFAGDKEDALASVKKSIGSFNTQDYKTYFSSFAEDNTEFPYVVSPLRHDAAAWKAFIEGTAALEYVNYHQQDELVQTYNGNSAVVTAYYTFTWKPKGGELNTQSGRASMVLVKQGGKWLTVHMHFSKMF
ncbi:MAG: nuclear transport factor 2 family protein [Bacteroidota bacterium]